MTDRPTSTTDLISDTDYFEIDSPTVGARFAVWVTRPLVYAALPDNVFPALYVTDGNLAAAVTAPYSALFGADLIGPMEPYVQVSIGYPGATVAEANSIRNRDLLPPNEPVPLHLTAALEGAVEAGALTREQADEMLTVLRNPHGDRFLAFIENELHPVVTQRYRVNAGRAGLFGYSYGGLFSLYALARQSALFDRIGAGSPGIMGTDSQIFTLLDELAARQATFDGVRLCLTTNDREGNGPVPLYQSMGRGFNDLLERLRVHDFRGLAVSTRVIEEETHISGFTASFLTFVRNCYSVAVPDAG